MTQSPILVRTAGIEFVGNSFFEIIEDIEDTIEQLEAKDAEITEELKRLEEEPEIERVPIFHYLDGRLMLEGYEPIQIEIELEEEQKRIKVQIQQLEAEIKNLKELTNVI